MVGRKQFKISIRTRVHECNAIKVTSTYVLGKKNRMRRKVDIQVFLWLFFKYLIFARWQKNILDIRIETGCEILCSYSPETTLPVCIKYRIC